LQPNLASVPNAHGINDHNIGLVALHGLAATAPAPCTYSYAPACLTFYFFSSVKKQKPTILAVQKQ